MNKTDKNKKMVIAGISVVAVVGVAVIVAMSFGTGITSTASDKTSNSPSGIEQKHEDAKKATSSGDKSQTNTVLDTTNGSPFLGKKDAPITIIEFGDYQCPFCKKWNENTKPKIYENYIKTGKARLVFLDLPVIGPDSKVAAQGSYCAADQGLYWEYHDHLYENQGHERDGWASKNNLVELVSDIDGMNAEDFRECIESGKYSDRVDSNQNVALNVGANSTPSFIIVDNLSGKAQMIKGAQPYDVFDRVMNEMLSS